MVAVMTLAGLSGLQASSNDRPVRLGISLAAGAFRADQGSVRSLYGVVQTPFHAQVDVFILRRVSVFAGFRYLSSDGSTRIVGPVIAEEQHPLRLRVSSFRAGACVFIPAGRFMLQAAIGGSYSRVRERWLDLPLDAALGGPGLFARLGAGYPLGRNWEIFSRFEYSTLATGEGSLLEPSVSLGGAEAVLGLMFKI